MTKDQEEELQTQLAMALELLQHWQEGEVHALADTTRNFLQTVPRPQTYAEQLVNIVQDKLTFLERQYAMQIIDMRRWAEDEGAGAKDLVPFAADLMTPVEPSVMDLLEKAQGCMIFECDWCGVRGPLKRVPDPHGADSPIDVCVWGCPDEPKYGIA